MSSRPDPARDYLDQAGRALSEGDPAKALELAEQALEQNERSHAGYVIRGIALAQLGRPDEASASFRRAIELDPAQASAYYNYALHLKSLGHDEESRAMAEEALRRDPGHAGAKALLGPNVQEGRIPSVRSSPRGSGIPLVRGLGGTWEAMGWIIAIGSLGVFAAAFINSFESAQELTRSGSGPASFSELLEMAQQRDVPPGLTIGMWAIKIFASLWVLLDVLDKKISPLWLVPFVVCCCCEGAWIFLPIYLVVTRRAAQ